MTALPAVPNVAQLILRWILGTTDHAQTRLWVACSGTPLSSGAVSTWASAISSAAVSDLVPYLNDSNSLDEIEITDMSSALGVRVVLPVGHAGVVTSSPLPAGVAVNVQYQISRRYRGGKPRSYLPLFSAADLLNPNEWSPTSRSNLVSAYGAFLAHVISDAPASVGASHLANVSYYEGFTNEAYGTPVKYRRVPTLRAAGPVVDPILSWTIDSRPSSQRRRNRSGS